MPLISVIIPVYNGDRTIKETVESVLNQTFRDFELIVIDDGSIDRTLEVLSAIHDPRMQIFSYQNAGLAASRNRGLAIASGEYVSFLDADDLWMPNKLLAQLRTLIKDMWASVAYSWTDYIDESGNFVRPGGYLAANGDVLAKLLTIYFLENGSNALISRQAVLDVGGFDETLSAAEDWDLFLKLASRYRFVAVLEVQVLYRLSANSMSADVARQEAACVKVLKRTYKTNPELRRLKKDTWANLYRYLAFKALDGAPSRVQGLLAAKFLAKMIFNDWGCLRHPGMGKIGYKVMVWILYSREKAGKIVARSHSLPRIHEQLLLHFRI